MKAMIAITTVAKKRYGRSGTGFTLLEVVLATALFAMTMTCLGSLMWSSAHAAIQAQLQTEALSRCETLMNEVVAGVYPLQAVSNTAAVDDPTWQWSMQVAQGPYPELIQVDVIVEHTSAGPLGIVRSSLRRWVRDPQWFIDAAEAAAAKAADAVSTVSGAASTGTSSGGSSGSSR